MQSIGNHKEIADKILKLINDTVTRKKIWHTIKKDSRTIFR